MQRNSVKRKGKKSGTRPRKAQVPRPLGFKSLLTPPSVKRWVTYRTFLTQTNYSNTGSNTTYPLYALGSLSPSPIGMAAYWQSGGSTPSMYLSSRLLAARTRVNFVNQEAFGLRVAVVLTSDTPINNSLNNAGPQYAYLSQASCVSTDKLIGPLTGNGMTTLSLQASNVRNLGVRNVRGLSDPYTSSWNSTTGATVTATAGLVLIVMTLATVNQTNSGVIVDIEVDLLCEFFSPSPIKTS